MEPCRCAGSKASQPQSNKIIMENLCKSDVMQFGKLRKTVETPRSVSMAIHAIRIA